MLLSFVEAGEREALAWLFRRYAKAIRNLGRRILRNDEEAEDIVQEVFLYVQRKCDLFRSSKGTGRSWIFQIAYTQALLRRRQLKSRGFYSSGIAVESSKTESRTNSDGDFGNTIEGLFGRSGWKKILESLTEDQRETFRLHFFEGYTFAEIARKLGQSYVNIRHHYYRGVEKLRKQVHEGGGNRR